MTFKLCRFVKKDLCFYIFSVTLDRLSEVALGDRKVASINLNFEGVKEGLH